MEKLTSCRLSAVLLLAALSSVLAEDIVSYRGGKLQLSRPPFSEEITGIVWKHNLNLVAEWVKEKVPLHYYGEFLDRTTLNTTTGSLEIRNVSSADSGVYSVEINNKVQPERYNAEVKEPPEKVLKPDVIARPVACSTTSETCMLTCEGGTQEAEPITYSWKKGDGVWMDGEKNMSISNDEATQTVKTFTCRMKNPAPSEMESAPLTNPFLKGSSSVGVVVGVLFGLAVLGGLVGVGYCKREAILKKFSPSNNPVDNNAAANGNKLSSAGGDTSTTVQEGLLKKTDGEASEAADAADDAAL